MALAFYRKYRPKSFEEIVGQEHITSVLQNAAKQNRLAHAYLFYGARGTGKTTTARLIAKLANCEKRSSNKAFSTKGVACNECKACVETDAGRALDVIEIDAASNRGIDEIRSLKEGISLSPTTSPYKVYIVDEAHQLTKDAWNALLKTLEEPPAHAILILATTEYEKIPATILSRTQKFHFRLVSIRTIAEKLARIAKEESLTVDSAALELIAGAASGSFRDAESLLDQLASSKQKIDVELVETTIGKVGFDRTRRFAELLLEKKVSEALVYISDVQKSGHNIADLAKETVHFLRRALSLSLDASLSKLYTEELTSTELEGVRKASALVSSSKTPSLITALIRAYGEMRYSPFASVPLEVAIIEELKK